MVRRLPRQDETSCSSAEWDATAKAGMLTASAHERSTSWRSGQRVPRAAAELYRRLPTAITRQVPEHTDATSRHRPFSGARDEHSSDSVSAPPFAETERVDGRCYGSLASALLKARTAAERVAILAAHQAETRSA